MNMLPILLLVLSSALCGVVDAAQFCDGTLFVRRNMSLGLEWSNAVSGQPIDWYTIPSTSLCTLSFVADGNKLWCIDAQATIHSFELSDDVILGAPPKHYTYTFPWPYTISPNSKLLYWDSLPWGFNGFYSLFCVHSDSKLICGIPNATFKTFFTVVSPLASFNAVSYVRERPRVVESRSALKWIFDAAPTPIFGVYDFSYTGLLLLWTTAEAWVSQVHDVVASSGNGYMGYTANKNAITVYDFQIAYFYNMVPPSTGRVIEATPTLKTCDNFLFRVQTNADITTSIESTRNVLLPTSIVQRTRSASQDTILFTGNSSGMAWTPKIFNWPTPPPETTTQPIFVIPPTSNVEAPEPPVDPPSGPSCKGKPPNDFFFCRDGAWWANVTVSTPTVIISGTANIGGSLIVTNSTVFNGLEASIAVDTCYTIEGSLTLTLTEDEFQQILKHKATELQLIRGKQCNSNDARISASLRTTGKSCKKVAMDTKNTANGVFVTLSVNSARCNAWWIVLICVFAFILMSAGIIAFVFTYYKVCRQTARPYSE